MSMKGVEDFLQVFDVVSFLKAFNKHVVNIDFHIMIDMVFEDLVN